MSASPSLVFAAYRCRCGRDVTAPGIHCCRACLGELEVPPETLLRAEQRVLGSIFRYASLKDSFLRNSWRNHTVPEDFSVESHRLFFRAMRTVANRSQGRHHHNYENVHPAGVQCELERTGHFAEAGGEAYLAILVDSAVEIQDIEGAVKTVFQAAQARRLTSDMEKAEVALAANAAAPPEAAKPTTQPRTVETEVPMSTLMLVESEVLPSRPDAERSLLGAVLIDGSLLGRVREFLVPEDFASEGHRLVYEACLALADRREGVDLVTVQYELEKTGRLERAGGTAVLSALVDRVPDVENVEGYARLVREASLRRLVILQSRRAIRDAVSAPDAGTVIENAQRELLAVAKRAMPFTATAGNLVVDPVEILRTEVYTGERYPTRVQPLDDLLGGGIAPGYAFAVAGAPGEGKTLLFVQLAAELLTQGALVVILAGDEDRSGIAQRIGQYVGFEKDELNSAHPRTLDALEEKLRGGVIKIFPDPEHPPMTVEDVEAEMNVLKAKNPEALLVLLVDSLQTVKCEASQPDDAETAAVTKVVEALRGVKKRTNALVLATSEAPRSSYASRDPGSRTRAIASFAGSRTPEFRFDVLAFIGTTGEGGDERARLEITKNRLGHRKGSVVLRLDRERARWLPEDAAVVAAQREEQQVQERNERDQKERFDRRSRVKGLVLAAKDRAVGVSLVSMREAWKGRPAILLATLAAMAEEGILEEYLGPAPAGGGRQPKFFRLAGGGAR